MTSSAIETFEEAKANLRDRVADACRQTAHLSHEARLMQSRAADAVEDAVHAAKRAATRSVKRSVEEFADLKDEAVHRVKRQPLPALGIALGVGLVVGMAVGWISRQSRQRE